MTHLVFMCKASGPVCLKGISLTFWLKEEATDCCHMGGPGPSEPLTLGWGKRKQLGWGRTRTGNLGFQDHMNSWIVGPGGLSRLEQSYSQWVELRRPVLQVRGWQRGQEGCSLGRAVLQDGNWALWWSLGKTNCSWMLHILTHRGSLDIGCLS